MTEHDALHLYLQDLKDNVKGAEPSLARVITVLVEETLRYRDELKAGSGAVLTVAQTRSALDGFQAVMAGRPMPRNLGRHARALIALWLYSLKDKAN